MPFFNRYPDRDDARIAKDTVKETSKAIAKTLADKDAKAEKAQLRKLNAEAKRRGR